MNTSIQFLRDPEYQDSVVLFILAPAGISFDAKEIGKNLFGANAWTHEALLIDGLAPKASFRYSDISFHWTDFLDLAFRHVDHTLFFVTHKGTFKEIVRENLVHQNPDLYSFSFHKFHCESRKGMPESIENERAVDKGLQEVLPGAGKNSADVGRGKERPEITVPAKADHASSAAQKLIEARSALRSLLESGWSANAVSKSTGITAMTIGSIKNGKSTQVSSRVYDALMHMHADATAGRIAPALRKQATPVKATPVKAAPVKAAPVKAAPVKAAPVKAAPVKAAPASERAPAGNAPEQTRLVRGQLIAVDAEKLAELVDKLTSVFSDGIADLREMRSLIANRDQR